MCEVDHMNWQKTTWHMQAGRSY